MAERRFNSFLFCGASRFCLMRLLYDVRFFLSFFFMCYTTFSYSSFGMGEVEGRDDVSHSLRNARIMTSYKLRK